MSLEEKIRSLIAEKLDVEPHDVRDESALVDDLGADSIRIVELIMAMEENFDIEISDDEAVKIRTVGDAIEFVKANI